MKMERVTNADDLRYGQNIGIRLMEKGNRWYGRSR